METEPSNINIHFSTGTKSFDIHFLFKNAPATYSAEAEIALRLLPSMQLGENIHMQNKPVDNLFLNAITDIQHIYKNWNPQYQITKILNTKRAEPASDFAGRPKKRVATFFSGGIDSFYTLLKHRGDITDIIFVHGLDIPLENTALREQTVTALKAIGADFNVNLVEVETNLKTALLPYGDWRLILHGVALASVGLLLQDDFFVIYIPASHEYTHLFPLGTHPILDHLWSTQSLRFIHDGAESTRLEKTELVSQSDTALRHLRVCWRNTGGAYNCGKCEKCLRTMITLYIFGKMDSCPTFSEPLSSKRVAKMKLKGKNTRKFARQNIARLQQMQGGTAIEKALKHALRTSMFKKLIKKSYK